MNNLIVKAKQKFRMIAPYLPDVAKTTSEIFRIIIISDFCSPIPAIHHQLRKKKMFAFSAQKLHVNQNCQLRQILEAPEEDVDLSNLQQQYILNDIQTQCERIEHIKQRLMEYQAILQRLRLLRSAKNATGCQPKHSTAIEGNTNEQASPTVQHYFAPLNGEQNTSSQQLLQQQVHVQREHQSGNMGNIDGSVLQMNETSMHLRKQRSNKKSHRLRRAVKNALREKRIVDEKLRETLKKNEAEVKYSAKLKRDVAVLKSKIHQLNLKLKQKERLCNDSKIRLAIHGETASLACRQIHNANKRCAELIEENKQLHVKYTASCLEVNNFRLFHVKFEAELDRVKAENKKHNDEVHKLKEVMDAEMTSLVQVLEENHNLLTQKTEIVNWLICENLKNKKRVEELEELKRNLEEEIRSTNAVLQAQHQELQVYEANQKIHEKNLLQSNQQQLTANAAEQITDQFQQASQINSIYHVVGCHNRMTYMLERIDPIPNNPNVPLTQTMLAEGINQNFVFPNMPPSMNNEAEVAGPSNQINNGHGQNEQCGRNGQSDASDTEEINVQIC
ncbi:unnamed protein product [Litomosoides sigmodontis]|uniref:Uncharacterized protein n=1 Tax=Litomosoides sigmodontis TaxID=42156 RepID=A0A3P6UKI5_LITSI|nr:unnamed protein product [Litomosoides sigmodontis]